MASSAEGFVAYSVSKMVLLCARLDIFTTTENSAKLQYLLNNYLFVNKIVSNFFLLYMLSLVPLNKLEVIAVKIK